MSVGDKTLVCRDCGENFTFTAGEQAFYLERGFVEPARCPNCRASRRQSRQNGDLGGVGAPRAERRLYPAVCAECGQETMVPFEPRNGRPVYCRDCYQRQRLQ
ncbi:MAG: zinc-ribbon domain containing protein [Nitrolancea sp.]